VRDGEAAVRRADEEAYRPGPVNLPPGDRRRGTTKATDSWAKGFSAVSVELDAVAPDKLRSLVEAAVRQHLPPWQLQVVKAAEASERAILAGIAARLRGADAAR
jgi:hypothetical protein